MASIADERFLHRVLDKRQVGPFATVLRFERRNLTFAAGQYLSVGLAGDLNIREYSVYSGINDPWLEILVRQVEGGLVSGRLAAVKAGDQLRVEGPFGYFTPEPGPLFLVASGSGIAPFHAMVRSDPSLDYTLLHGIRHDEECYEGSEYAPERYLPCVSQGKAAAYQGRVTTWLHAHPAMPNPGSTCYLSGNCDMIYEVYDMLRGRGIPSERIRAEVYF